MYQQSGLKKKKLPVWTGGRRSEVIEGSLGNDPHKHMHTEIQMHNPDQRQLVCIAVMLLPSSRGDVTQAKTPDLHSSPLLCGFYSK